MALIFDLRSDEGPCACIVLSTKFVCLKEPSERTRIVPFIRTSSSSSSKKVVPGFLPPYSAATVKKVELFELNAGVT